MKKSIVLYAGQVWLLSFLVFASERSLAQSCTNTWPGGSQSLSTLTGWSCSSSPAGTAPSSSSPTLTEDLTIGTMGNGDALTIDYDFTLTGNVIINSNAHVTIIIAAGKTFKVIGDFTDTNNNVTFDIEAGATLIVTNTLKAKNSTVFVGSGTIAGGTLDIGANTSCPGPCPSCDPAQGTTAFCTTYNSALPITLLSFSGSVASEKVTLNWSTSSELNFDYFVLEKSGNGLEFFKLGEVKGSGNSNTRRDYSYTDIKPFIGNSYYRLTSIDFDGYTEVFNNNVVRVTVKAEKNFSITQNPIQSFRLKGMVNFENAHGSVMIFDRMGSVIARYAISDSEIDVQLPTLSSGVYFAQFQSGEFSKTVRFAVNE